MCFQRPGDSRELAPSPTHPERLAEACDFCGLLSLSLAHSLHPTPSGIELEFQAHVVDRTVSERTGSS